MLNSYIGVGSNLAEPVEQVTSAITEIRNLVQCEYVQCSSLYKTPPMGPQDQPDYINAVIKIKTNFTALELLDNLQELEQLHDRRREKKWGPRTLDLDILLYSDQIINNTRLNIPHSGLYDRAFVLYPLLEIEPNLILPNGVSLDKQVASLGTQNIEIIR